MKRELFLSGVTAAGLWLTCSAQTATTTVQPEARAQTEGVDH